MINIAICDDCKQIYRWNRAIKIIFKTNFNEYLSDAINKSHAFVFLVKTLLVILLLS